MAKSASAVLLAAFALVMGSGCLNMDGGTTTSADSSSGGGSGVSGAGGGGVVIAPPSSTPTPNAAGVITTFDPTNSAVVGYAYDPNNPQTSFFVEFWLNGPRGVGTSLGMMEANANHAFFPTGPYAYTLTLPMQYQDGQMRQIYAYADVPNSMNANALGNSPLAFWAGVNLAGQSYYNANVQSAVASNCGGCHSWTYTTLKQEMATPDKFSGGTAAANTLINTALGGNGHGGGNRCGTASGSPCAEFQSWWAIEF